MEKREKERCRERKEGSKMVSRRVLGEEVSVDQLLVCSRRTRRIRGVEGTRTRVTRVGECKERRVGTRIGRTKYNKVSECVSWAKMIRKRFRKQVSKVRR